jgi:LCP family protein required for cell wall assembly
MGAPLRSNGILRHRPASPVQEAMQARTRRPHAALAATLSFLFPGLGQAYAGDTRLAAILAAPVLLLVAGGLITLLFVGDRLRNTVLSSSFLVAVLVLDVALLAWRLFAIAHAGLVDHPPSLSPSGVAAGGSSPPLALDRDRRPARTLAIVAALLIGTMAMHAWVGVIVTSLNSALGQVFIGGLPLPSSSASAQPLNQPTYHWNGTTRINFLLLGIDSGPRRSEALTDTILVVSVDPLTRTAFMVSIPRDTGLVPLPDRRIYVDGRYPGKINELTTVASQNPKLWCPDLSNAAGCGIRTLERSVGLYLGIAIHYYATVDLVGFAHMIDALGGLQLCLPGPMVDTTYGGPTWYPKVGITLPAGCNRYDGTHALAYARIRKGYIDMPDGSRETQDDFRRAARQQVVLLALRERFASTNLVFGLPSLLQAVGETVKTDFPRELAGDLASLLPLIAAPNIERVVLGLPGYTDPPLNPTLNYLLVPKRAAIRAEMLKLLGPDAKLVGWYLGSTSRLPPPSGPNQ